MSAPASRAGPAAEEPTLLPGSRDAALLLSVAHGQPGSAGELYGRYRDGALGVAISVLGDEMEAEDVVHEVFEELPRMARSYDVQRGSVPQWLYRVVRNRAIDHVRRRAREASRVAAPVPGTDEFHLVPSLAPSPSDELEAEEMLELIGRLDPRHAHLVRLAFVDGWSHSAIAGMTGLPLGTVKTRIRLSLRLIRSFLAEADVTPIPVEATVALAPQVRLVGDAARGSLARTMRRNAQRRYDVVGRAVIAAADTQPEVVVARPTSRQDLASLLARLDEVGWNRTPLVVLGSAEASDALLAHGGPVVMADDRGTALPLRLAVPAALGAGLRPELLDPVPQLLLHDPGAAILIGDRLGRVSDASPGAESLYGRTPRQLRRSYVSELSAMPPSWSEREWQRFAAQRWWAGHSVIRHPDGPPRTVYGVGWLTDAGAMISVAVPTRPARSGGSEPAA
jgi:RNA polymerase sigma-70 factor (ECF subfamily)